MTISKMSWIFPVASRVKDTFGIFFYTFSWVNLVILNMEIEYFSDLLLGKTQGIQDHTLHCCCIHHSLQKIMW